MPRKKELKIEELERATKILAEIKNIEMLLTQLHSLVELIIEEDKEITFRILFNEERKPPHTNHHLFYGLYECSRPIEKTKDDIAGIDLFIYDTDRVELLGCAIGILNRKKNKLLKALKSKGIKI